MYWPSVHTHWSGWSCVVERGQWTCESVRSACLQVPYPLCEIGVCVCGVGMVALAFACTVKAKWARASETPVHSVVCAQSKVVLLPLPSATLLSLCLGLGILLVRWKLCYSRLFAWILIHSFIHSFLPLCPSLPPNLSPCPQWHLSASLPASRIQVKTQPQKVCLH